MESSESSEAVSFEKAWSRFCKVISNKNQLRIQGPEDPNFSVSNF